MSKAVSALNGANAQGFVSVQGVGPQGMITLRGDLGSSKLTRVVEAVTGAKPPARGRIEMAGDAAVAWMSPDELLLVMPYGGVQGALATLSDKLKGEHHLAVPVSDARAMFQISGQGVREVIAKLCPVDMAPDRFSVGDFRRTRLAQVPAALWMADDQTVKIVCFRSVAQYVFDLLKNASEIGSEVGYF